MPWTLVVVGKTITIMANLNCRFIELDKLHSLDACRAEAGRTRIDLIAADVASLENRVKRVLREDVLDVGDEQLLMLLLVMNPEGQNRFDLAKQFLVGIGNQLIDV